MSRDDQNTTVVLDTSGDELQMLRDVVIRAAGLTGSAYCQPPEVMIKRAHNLLWAACMASDAIKGFLGYGGPEAYRDILSGNGNLS